MFCGSKLTGRSDTLYNFTSLLIFFFYFTKFKSFMIRIWQSI